MSNYDGCIANRFLQIFLIQSKKRAAITTAPKIFPSNGKFQNFLPDNFISFLSCHHLVNAHYLAHCHGAEEMILVYPNSTLHRYQRVLSPKSYNLRIPCQKLIYFTFFFTHFFRLRKHINPTFL